MNLRSMRRVKLQERFSSHVVDAGLGHSTKTADTHYLHVIAEHWRAGATITSVPLATEVVSLADGSGGVAGGVMVDTVSA